MVMMIMIIIIIVIIIIIITGRSVERKVNFTDIFIEKKQEDSSLKPERSLSY
jgi:ATP/ADP translocase